jgi:hypothetical protein
VTCPECRVSQLVDQSALVAVCSGCTKRIRCVECGDCGFYFAALELRKLQCSRCLKDIGPWKGQDIPFAALAEQRQGGVVPADGAAAATAAIASTAATAATAAAAVVPPDAGHPPKGGSALRWALVVAVVVAAGIAGFAYLHESTTPKAVTCPLAKATSTLTLSASRGADGDYRVTATGATVNRSSRSLRHVVVTWEVTYANGSNGPTTATLLPTQGAIAPGATSRWSGPAAINDGPVKPTGIKVLHTYTTVGHPSCLT